MRIMLSINTHIVYGGMVRERNRLVAIMANSYLFNWYLNNFVPIMMYPTGNIHCYDSTNSFELYSVFNEVISIQRIPAAIFSLKKMAELLEERKYILAYSDHYYIKGSRYYLKQHMFNEILIYGIDTDRHELAVHASQINNCEYGTSKMTFLEFIDSISNAANSCLFQESSEWSACFGHPFSAFTVKTVNMELNIEQIHFQYARLHKLNWYYCSRESQEQFLVGRYVFDGVFELCNQLQNQTQMQNMEQCIWSVKLLSEYLSLHAMRFKVVQRCIHIDCKTAIANFDLAKENTEYTYILLQKFYLNRRTYLLDNAKNYILIAKKSFSEAIELCYKALNKYTESRFLDHA